MEQTTDWTIRLKEVVLGPLKKITEMAGGATKKISGLAGATSNFAKQSTTAGKVAGNSLISLEHKLRQLETLQAKAWNPRHVQNYERAIRKTRSEIDKWNKMKVLPMSRGEAFSQNMAGAANEIPGLSRVLALAKNPVALSLAGGLAAGKVVKESTELSRTWEYNMAKINATALLPEKNLKALDDQLVKIGKDSGGSFERIPDAYEKILSITGEAKMSLDVLKVSIDGAKAGFTDLDIVGKSVASTMSILGKGKASAQEVLDTYLKAKRIGAGEFSDFATYMPGLISSGRTLNMNWKQTTGIFSYMTQKTKDAADATMLMKNMFTALSKPQILKGLDKAGIKMFDKRGEMRRLDEILMDLEKKLGLKSTRQKLNFFNSIGLHDAQAKEALQTLLADTKLLKEQIDGVNDSFGETNKQLKATGNSMRTWGQVSDTFKSIGKVIGDVVLPFVDKFATRLLEVLAIFDSETWKKAFNFNSSQKHITLEGKMNEMASNFAKNKLFRTPMQDLSSADTLGIKKQEEERKALGAQYYREAREHLSKGYTNFLGDRRNQAVKGGSQLESKFGLWLDKLSTKKEFKPFEPLNKINKGKGNNGDDPADPIGGGNSGPKTLIMNVGVTNYFRKDDEKVKQKHTDDIIDAARDALVTIGTE